MVISCILKTSFTSGLHTLPLHLHWFFCQRKYVCVVITGLLSSIYFFSTRQDNYKSNSIRLWVLLQWFRFNMYFNRSGECSLDFYCISIQLMKQISENLIHNIFWFIHDEAKFLTSLSSGIMYYFAISNTWYATYKFSME